MYLQKPLAVFWITYIHTYAVAKRLNWRLRRLRRLLGVYGMNKRITIEGGGK